MDAENINFLKIRINGVEVSSVTADVYWNSAPACGILGTYSFSLDLDKETNTSIHFEIQDGGFDEIWSGNLDMDAGVCANHQLIWE